MEWLQQITDWLAQQLKDLWDAIEEFFTDFIVSFVEAVLNLVAAIVAAIPVPDFIQSVSVCGLLGQAGPVAAWASGVMQLGVAMPLLMSAVGFRLLRKFLTLFQW